MLCSYFFKEWIFSKTIFYCILPPLICMHPTLKLKSLEFHDFHLVESSFYPFFVSSNLFFFFSTTVFYLHAKISFLWVLAWFFIFLSTFFNWLYLVYFESIKGYLNVPVHTVVSFHFFFLPAPMCYVRASYFFSLIWAL